MSNFLKYACEMKSSFQIVYDNIFPYTKKKCLYNKYVLNTNQFILNGAKFNYKLSQSFHYNHKC